MTPTDFVLLRRRAGLDRAGLRASWTMRSAPAGSVLNLMQPVDIPFGSDAYDGVLELPAGAGIGGFGELLDAGASIVMRSERRVALIEPVGPGVKFFSIIRRKPDVARRDFLDHWERRHGPLVRDFPPFAGRLAGYVQHHCLPDQERNLAGLPQQNPYDGVAELHFASPAAFQAFFGLGVAMQPIRDDEESFLLRPTVRMLVDEAGPPAA